MNRVWFTSPRFSLVDNDLDGAKCMIEDLVDISSFYLFSNFSQLILFEIYPSFTRKTTKRLGDISLLVFLFLSFMVFEDLVPEMNEM